MTRRKKLTAEDIWALPRVGSPVPSPDGSRLIVPVLTYSVEANEGTTRLWLMDSEGGGRRALTTAEQSSGSPSWAPDGKRIAFIRKPGGKKDEKKPGAPKHPEKPQLYIMPVDGGEPERLTDLPLGAADPKFFPDGESLAFLVPLLKDAYSVKKTAEAAKKLEEDTVKAVVTEDRWHRYWDHDITQGPIIHVFRLDLRTMKLEDLTPDNRRLWSPMDSSGSWDLSPDGKEIAWTACYDLPPYLKEVRYGVFTTDVKTRKTTFLTSYHEADAFRPRYSPDGRLIVYGIQRDLDFYADKARVVVYDRKRKKHDCLTEDWDRSAAGWEFGASSNSVFLVAEDRARVGLFSLDLRRPGIPRPLARTGTISTPRPTRRRVFTTMDMLTRPGEVVSFGLDGSGPKRVTDFSVAVMKKTRLGEVEEVHFKGAGGDRVQMFLVWPPGVRKGARRKLPLLHLIHGGPHGVFGDTWFYRWNAQTFAAQGYLVAMVNFHGSTGWGQEFTKCIQGRWGDQPLKDVEAATDELIERKYVDPKRMAVTGGSYGGYMVAWICSQVSRYKCAINHAGVSDFQIEWASDVTHHWEKSMGGSPWENQAGMDKYNPMRHARGFKTPMLVIHGE
ncbi:MAG TPA: S9 family peptidase, partial [Thermoplasmata archaeon]|nr:S9 family peptidase [Thermoplasmata archaeon]